MVLRNNDATLNRPQGDRILNAPYLFVNLPDYLRIIKKEKAWDQGDHNSITVFKGDGLTVVLSAMKKDANIEKVQTEGFMVLQILDGQITVHTGDGDMELDTHQMMVFHPSIEYSLTANRESAFLLSHYQEAQTGGNIL